MDANERKDRRLRRIGQWGRALAAVSLLLAVALPLTVAAVLWTMPAEAFLMGLGLSGAASADLTTGARLVGGALMMLAPLVLAYGIVRLRRAFLAFAAGRVFDPEVYVAMRAFAVALILSVFVGVVAGAAASVAVSLAIGAEGTLSIRAGSPQLFTLGLAALFWTFAHVFAEAEALAEENRQFV